MDTLQWVRDHKHYAGDPIHVLSVGGTLAILPNTWLERNQKELGVIWLNGEESPNSNRNHLWTVPKFGNTYQVRVTRLNELIQVGEESGFNIHRAVIDPQKELENIMQERMTKHYAIKRIDQGW